MAGVHLKKKNLMPSASAVNTPVPRRLNRSDYKTLSLSALGGALEFYDFVVFVFFTALISKQFFPADAPEWLRQFQTYGIFAAGYLARPLGGIVMAHFGDRLGRKRMFTFSIILMAAPTLAIALLPTYAQAGALAPLLLMMMRILQGIAVGGEVPGAWVFVAEHAPSHKVGYALSILTGGLNLGILFGSGIATLVHWLLTPDQVAAWGWRLAFAIGGVFGLLSAFLRRWLQETPVFAELKAQKALAKELPLKRVMQAHGAEVVLSMLLTWMLAGAIVVAMLMMPSLLQSLHHFAATPTLEANSLAIVLLVVGCTVTGILCDRVGPSRVLAVGSGVLAVVSWCFYIGVAIEPQWLFWLYALLGLAVGVVCTVPFVMVMLFPAEVRFSGLSFSYNVSYAIFGGLTPMLVSLMMKWNALGPVWYLFGLCVLGGLCALWLWRWERQGRLGADA